ncbi:hypothetical protein MCBMB27_02092 [Methylobacterium phyllosphaerae]|uniref:Uncharacterized protein n=1 Tax=Methylobacterium phyllosphaerae TaxID=418223 RepID=A0AAE8HQ36_9HYPH|nr:hypothetical protein [Methylobacterium phyllosphaerae]APT31383.1 hypothetical protein MCBMB27_02092 [Methylobacterium phyllosphaerae]SFG64330.1 hypothetical protein SAMN05192567_10641 [Methylobacterium phyllosphaerae]
MADDRLADLERLALVQNGALRVLIEHVRALTVVNGALLVQLSGQIDRDVIREAAFGALAAQGGVPGGLAGTLVEALTLEPAEQEDVMRSTLASLSARLQ